MTFVYVTDLDNSVPYNERRHAEFQAFSYDKIRFQKRIYQIKATERQLVTKNWIHSLTNQPTITFSIAFRAQFVPFNDGRLALFTYNQMFWNN